MIDKKLLKKLNTLRDGKILLFETNAERVFKVHLAVVKYFVTSKYRVIVLSASKPCENLFDLYKEAGIDTSNLIIICPHKKNGQHEKSNVIHVTSSSSLTEISLALSKYITATKDKRFILIDTLSAMSIQNEPVILAKFISFLLTKMRINNVGGLLILAKSETDPRLRAQIIQLCDKCLDV